jgi:hypothetical protein
MLFVSRVLNCHKFSKLVGETTFRKIFKNSVLDTPHGWKKPFRRNWNILGHNFRRKHRQTRALLMEANGPKDEAKEEISESQLFVLAKYVLCLKLICHYGVSMMSTKCSASEQFKETCQMTEKHLLIKLHKYSSSHLKRSV